MQSYAPRKGQAMPFPWRHCWIGEDDCSQCTAKTVLPPIRNESGICVIPCIYHFIDEVYTFVFCHFESGRFPVYWKRIYLVLSYTLSASRAMAFLWGKTFPQFPRYCNLTDYVCKPVTIYVSRYGITFSSEGLTSFSEIRQWGGEWCSLTPSSIDRVPAFPSKFESSAKSRWETYCHFKNKTAFSTKKEAGLLSTIPSLVG